MDPARSVAAAPGGVNSAEVLPPDLHPHLHPVGTQW